MELCSWAHVTCFEHIFNLTSQEHLESKVISKISSTYHTKMETKYTFEV
jgi:hypothetical protein